MKNNKRILLVAKNLEDVILVRRALKDLNITNPLVVVGDGLEALKHLQNPENAHPSIIISDLEMPRMGGIELCHRLKKDVETKDIPVIFMMSTERVGDKVKGFEAGGVDYITKPFQQEELLARIQPYIKIANPQKNLEKQTIKPPKSNQEFEEEIKAHELHLSRSRILVVDDSSANLQLLTFLLSKQGYIIHSASSGELALRFIQSTIPDLILLDIKMPGIDGFEVCRHLKKDAKTKDIPVIFMTSMERVKDKVKGFEVGGVDYITKPFQGEELLARIQTHLKISNLQKNVEKRAIELIKSNQQLEQEIEARKQAKKQLKIFAEELEHTNKELENLVLIDALTALYNRRGFFTLTEQQLTHSRRTGRKMMLVYGDLNGLKKINDTFGHKEGDFALIAAATILKETFRASDIIARIGGDEFAVLALESSKDNKRALEVRLNKKQQAYNKRSEKAYEISLSIGIVECNPNSRSSIDQLLNIADALMYENKKARRN